MKAAIPELSADTRALAAALRAVEAGQIVTYEALTAVIGREVRSAQAYCLLRRAVRMLEHEDIVFGTVRSVGLRRLPDSDIVRTADDAFSRLRRGGRQAARRLMAVKNIAELSRDEQIAHSASLSALAVVVHISKGSSRRQIEKKIQSGPQAVALPIARTLEAFK